MQKLQFLKEIDGIQYYLYKPSLFKLYQSCYNIGEVPPYFNRTIHRVRMIRELFKSHYRVVYMYKNKDVLGHLVVARGGSRIAISTKKDIVIGPIWVVPSQRSKGFASEGIKFILNEMMIDYNYAYEYIEKDNTPSIRTVEKNNFDFVDECNEYGIFRTLKSCKSGHLNLYRIKNPRS